MVMQVVSYLSLEAKSGFSFSVKNEDDLCLMLLLIVFGLQSPLGLFVRAVYKYSIILQSSIREKDFQGHSFKHEIIHKQTEFSCTDWLTAALTMQFEFHVCMAVWVLHV